MREIKFRAWDVKRKKFNYLDLRDAIEKIKDAKGRVSE